MTGMPASTIARTRETDRPGALELDRVGARLLDEADRVLDRLLVGDLERAERHVADDDRMPGRARDRARQEQHLVHRHRHGRALVAEHDHRGRVADEDHVDACVLGEPRAGRVVGGDHHDLLAAPLHLGELGQGQLSLGRCAHVLLSFQDDVVDQPCLADADGGGEHALAVEVRDLDVVDVEAVEQLAGAGRGPSSRARAAGRAPPRAPRARGTRSATRARARRRRGRSGGRGSRASRFRSRTSCLTTAACCASFWPK